MANDMPMDLISQVVEQAGILFRFGQSSGAAGGDKIVTKRLKFSIREAGIPVAKVQSKSLVVSG
jgi:hypothetical protein